MRGVVGFVLSAALMFAHSANALARMSPPAASTTRPLPADGATVALPGIGAFEGTVTVPENDAPPGTTVRLTVSAREPAGVPRELIANLGRHAAQTVAWLEADVSHDVTFGFGTVAYRFVLPLVSSTNDAFYAVSCDTFDCRRPYVFGPMRRDGDALAFSTRNFPFHFTFSAHAHHAYLVAIYHTPEMRSER